MNSFFAFYNALPVCMRKGIGKIYRLIPNEIVLGHKYRELKRELRLFEKISLQEKEAYLVNKIKKVLVYAYNHTTYYRNLFNQIDFRPDEFSDLSELERIPTTTKEMVMNNIESFISDEYQNSKKKEKVTTGGTSGRQMIFYQEKKVTAVRCKAYFDYLFKKEGYTKKKKMAVIRNNVLKEGELWVEDFLQNKCFFDPFHLTDDNLNKMILKLNQDKIMYFHSYPSSLMSIAEYMKRTGDRLTYKPKAIFASSENLYEGQREFIEEYFNCPMHIHYGHSENGTVAGWCLHDTHYHIEDCFGYCELVYEGKQIVNNEKWGEIVTTGFNNKVMPLIRYATGDYAQYIYNVSCNNYRCLARIQGRWIQEMLYNKNGIGISMTAINEHSDIYDNVIAYQFYQDTIGKCFLNIVKGNNYSEADEKKILSRLHDKVGEGLIIIPRYVSCIDKNRNGKYQYIIQKIDNRI